MNRVAARQPRAPPARQRNAENSAVRRRFKLDRSFVTGCAADPLKRSLCQTVVDLGHRFGATVCAEGVEQEGDLRSLIGQSFDTAQGYFFAKPMPASELMAFLTQDTHWQIGLAEPRPAAAPA